MFFTPFSIAITSLGEEIANLSAFRTYVRFTLVCFFSVFSSSWCLGRAAVCDCGTPWTFLLLLYNGNRLVNTPAPSVSIVFSLNMHILRLVIKVV